MTRSPTSRRLTLVACIAAAFALTATAVAGAAAPAPAVVETPHRDPWIPPEQRPATATPAKSTTADVANDVRQRLLATFTAADRDGDGMLTRDEAARGFGFVARHFDAIDATGSGHVSFDALMDFLAGHARDAQGARR